MISLKLLHHYADVAAGATLILQSLFVFSLYAETGFYLFKEILKEVLSSKERAGD
jgi:hypothetical protein